LRGSIRKTDFTWDPQQESRSASWKRIKKHVEAELDRINTESRQQLRHERWRALPTRERDQTILIDHDQHGVDVLTLAHQHRVSATRIREILRTERYRQRQELAATPVSPPEVKGPPHRQLTDLLVGFPQSNAVPTDP
jgi:hypothetical protein